MTAHSPDLARPVFVVAAPRSGASLLACALGQHPRLWQVHEGEWLTSLCDLLAGTGAAPPAAGERATALRAYGHATGLLAGVGSNAEGGRWVAAEPELSSHIVTLAALFPDSRFVHVIRDADLVALSLSAAARGADGATGGTQIALDQRRSVSLQDAYSSWLGSVQEGVAAADALGTDRLLTVRHADLLRHPDEVVRRCLEFAGEPYSEACLRPLRGVRDLPVTPADLAALMALDEHPSARTARVLTSELLGQPAVSALATRNGSRPDAQPEQRADATDVRGARGRGRIAMVTEHFPKFSETFFVDKFTHLSERGWDVHVVCGDADPQQLEYFPAVRAAVEKGERVHVTGDLDRELLALEPDIVHFEYGALARGRMYLRDLLGCAVVVSFRGYDINYLGLDHADFYGEVWEGADVLHLVSEDVWTRAQRRGCPAQKRHAVIRDATDTSGFDPPRRDVPPVLGTPERPLRVLSVGRLHWKKGYEYGLAALARLRDAGVHVSTGSSATASTGRRSCSPRTT